ncbi:MAG: hypothetical protein GW778_00825 [Alphaproteobacteria bacterium]|nr:hypothetical protein [Alphaproteobacteria bacterium]
MSRLTLFIAAAILAPIASTQAYAQNACGQVIDMDRMGAPVKYCNNMYDRQFEYRKQRIEFRQKIDDRREEYAAPAIEAYNKYKKDLADLNNERTHENDVVAR